MRGGKRQIMTIGSHGDGDRRPAPGARDAASPDRSAATRTNAARSADINLIHVMSRRSETSTTLATIHGWRRDDGRSGNSNRPGYSASTLVDADRRRQGIATTSEERSAMRIESQREEDGKPRLKQRR